MGVGTFKLDLSKLPTIKDTVEAPSSSKRACICTILAIFSCSFQIFTLIDTNRPCSVETTNPTTMNKETPTLKSSARDDLIKAHSQLHKSKPYIYACSFTPKTMCQPQNSSCFARFSIIQSTINQMKPAQKSFAGIQ